MLTKWTFTPDQPGAVRNIASWEVSSENNQPAYRIDVSWPLSWSSAAETSGIAKAIYLVDGNAMFLSATEAVRRRYKEDAVVVGIGYPLTDTVYSPRRSLDLTPPCDHYTPPERPDGRPYPEPYGGADKLLTLITDVVQPFLTSSVFPRVSFSRTALFGHSYGGLFVLHALFTRPASFDVYLAASPSIWWNDRVILSEMSQFDDAPEEATSRLALRMSFGSREQAPVRQRGESPEQFRLRERSAARRRMADNCKELYAQLLESGRLGRIEIREYVDEDHGSVIAPALSGGISHFLDMKE